MIDAKYAQRLKNGFKWTFVCENDDHSVIGVAENEYNIKFPGIWWKDGKVRAMLGIPAEDPRLELNEWEDQIPWSVLKVDWVAMDCDGLWWGYTHEPVVDDEPIGEGSEQHLWMCSKGDAYELDVVKMPEPPSSEESKVKRPRNDNA